MSVYSISTSKMLFSLKCYIGAMFAFYVALSLDLERPYWSIISAYIVSQPLAGAVRSKAFYRICGSFLGAVGTIALIPNFVNAPLLLSLVLSLWVSGLLYLSVLDRTPRSYAFFLAGYTVGIIGFPSVNTPNDIFYAAVSRFEEITIGIIFATVMHSIVFPHSVAFVFRQSLNAWWLNAKKLMQNIFSSDPKELITSWQSLTAEVTELYILSTHLAFDTTNLRNSSVTLALDERMGRLLSILYAIADCFNALHHEKSSEFIQLTKQRIEVLSTTTKPSEDEQTKLIDEKLKQLTPEIKADSSWSDLLKMSFSTYLDCLIRLCKECQDLREYLFSYTKTIPNIDLQLPYGKKRPLHKSHKIAFLSALATFVAIMVVCIFWIAIAWPDGATAAQLTAIACCFFASKNNPARFILNFMYVTILTIPVTAFYLFVILPRVDGFFMLAMVLAPYYLMAGILMVTPSLSGAGLATVLVISTLMSLQNRYNPDFALFLNTSLAAVLGMGAAAFFNYLFRTMGEDWHIRHLFTAIHKDLTNMASQEKPANIAAFTLRTEDRLGLLAPLLQNAPEKYTIDLQGMKNLSIGLDIINLQNAMTELPAAETKYIGQLLNFLAQHKKDYSQLLLVIDYALTEVTVMPSTIARDQALLGLCGLRRNLFPEASPYVPIL